MRASTTKKEKKFVQKRMNEWERLGGRREAYQHWNRTAGVVLPQLLLQLFFYFYFFAVLELDTGPHERQANAPLLICFSSAE
jgi:hypothetical protein